MTVEVLSPAGMVSIDAVASSALKAGDVIRAGQVWAFALHDAANGEPVALCTECKLVKVPKSTQTGHSFVAGQALSWNAGASRVDDSRGGTPRQNNLANVVGYAHKAAARRDTTVELVWRPILLTAQIAN